MIGPDGIYNGPQGAPFDFSLLIAETEGGVLRSAGQFLTQEEAVTQAKASLEANPKRIIYVVETKCMLFVPPEHLRGLLS